MMGFRFGPAFCAGAVLLAGCGSEPRPSADRPAALEGIAHERYLDLRERAKDSEAQLVFLGDSITALWNREGQPAWERLTAGRQALNLGVGGDRTQNLLWRLQDGQLEGLLPRAIVVLIGTNNANDQEHTPQEIAAGVRAVVGELQTLAPQARILLLAILPRGEWPCRERGNVVQVNQILAPLADREAVTILDVGPLFLAPDGHIPQELMYDHLHLTEKGYELLAEAIEPWLRVNLDPFLPNPVSTESR